MNFGTTHSHEAALFSPSSNRFFLGSTMTIAQSESVEFSHKTVAKIRYSDTDRQGHVNNAVFATLLEIGRVELLYDPENSLFQTGADLVLVHLSLDFKNELRWPGEVEIVTAVLAIGRSSVRLRQSLAQYGKLAATAQTVSVLVDEATKLSTPWTSDARLHLERYLGPSNAT